MARRSAPVRTCVGCRERAVAAELLRVVAVPGKFGFRVLPDPARRMPGRGASLHPDPSCLAAAERRRAFPRAFRLPGPPDVTAVREQLGVQGSTRDETGPEQPPVDVAQERRQVDTDEHSMKSKR